MSTTIRNMPARERMLRARMQLAQSHPFFASLALHMELRERPGLGTMQVDGKHLEYDPAFVVSLPEPELIGVVVHETQHIALLHHTRRGGRDLADWNRACDYAINPGILAEGLTLPKDMLFDAAFDGMGAEQIYAELQKRKPPPPPPKPDEDDEDDEDGDEQDQGGGQDPGDDSQDDGDDGDDGQGQGTDPGGCGGVVDAYLEDNQGVAEVEAQTEAMVRQCIAVASAGRSEIPEAAARILGELNRPRIDWRAEFGRFIDNATRHRLSWNKPSRRMLNLGYVMPGRVRDAVGDGIVFIDSSGSIQKDAETAFASEVQAMLETNRVERIHVVSVDDAIRNVQLFEQGDTIDKLVIKGGNGTLFDIAFDWAQLNVPEAAFIIYLTDMEVWNERWGTPPACPVLWCATGRIQTAPFGEVIPLDPYQ